MMLLLSVAMVVTVVTVVVLLQKSKEVKLIKETRILILKAMDLEIRKLILSLGSPSSVDLVMTV